MRIFRDVDLLHRSGVKTRVIHDGRERGGRRIEVLHLLRLVAGVAQVLRQLHRVAERAAGVRGHEIRHDELLHVLLLVDLLILLKELEVDRMTRLSHLLQHMVGDVLRRDLELAGDVIAHQLVEKCLGLVGQQIVEADAAADKDLFDARKLPELSQQRHIVAVVGDHVFARLREQALPVRAGPLRQLLFARGLAEICRRTAHVVDVALEVLLVRHGLGLRQKGFVTARLDDAPLMERQRAEAARAEAAAVGRETEAHLGDCRHAAAFFIRRMIRPAIRQVVDPVHLLLRKRLLRRVLDDEFMLTIRLQQPPRRKRVGVAVLQIEALGVFSGVRRKACIVRQPQARQVRVRLAHAEGRPVDVGHVMDVHPVVERVGDLDDAALAHAVEQKVGLRVEQDRALELVRPVIVVRKAAEACLDAADDDGCLFIGPADEVAVDGHGIVRPLSHHAAGREGVGLTALFRDGVVVDHRVHVSAGDEKAEPRLTEGGDGRRVPPVRLGEDADLIACVLQHARDDGVTEGGVIDIGVADDVYKVALRPAARVHILFADGQKFRHTRPPVGEIPAEAPCGAPYCVCCGRVQKSGRRI